MKATTREFGLPWGKKRHYPRVEIYGRIFENRHDFIDRGLAQISANGMLKLMEKMQSSFITEAWLGRYEWIEKRK